MLAPFLHEDQIEAGCDEAGRGCLAGPVFAAAVILPKDFYHPLLNDSKQLNESQRDILRPIIESQALSWAVASVSPQEIDKINILKASFLAMHRALDALSIQADALLIDGNRFVRYKETPHTCIVKGDSKFAAIAAASILAKTYRDEAMSSLASTFPQYQWDINKGYPTLKHREAIRQYGVSPQHRLSFQLLPQGEQLSFDF